MGYNLARYPIVLEDCVELLRFCFCLYCMRYVSSCPFELACFVCFSSLFNDCYFVFLKNFLSLIGKIVVLGGSRMLEANFF